MSLNCAVTITFTEPILSRKIPDFENIITGKASDGPYRIGSRSNGLFGRIKLGLCDLLDLNPKLQKYLPGLMPHVRNRKFYLNLNSLFIADGFRLIDSFNLPIVSRPYDLTDWARDITEAEYLDLVGPSDFDALLAKHDSLRWMMGWRSEPGHEGHYGQIEAIFHLIWEFKRGNRPRRYRLEVSDMG